VALERSEAKRTAFRYEYGSKYTAEQMVFVDESSFDRRTSIRGKHGHSPENELYESVSLYTGDGM
jgi:hypothetical protein